MSTARPFALLFAGLIPGLTLSFGQSSDPNFDSSTGTSTVMTGVDLTVPVLEPVPRGGFARLPQSAAAPSSGRRPATTPDAPDGISSLSIRQTMTEALIDERPSGDVWVRTKDFRASFTDAGFVAYPIFGAVSPREWPVRFSLRSAGRGAAAYDVTRKGRAARAASTITLPHRSVREVFHVGVDSVEQTFVFDALPGKGDLLLELAVETDLDTEVDGSTLRFAHPEFGGLTYGEAFVVDASGRAQSIERTWRAGAIHFTVPADFLAGATLPVTIDPVISTFGNGFGNTSDDAFPDICYGGDPGRYYVCWQEQTSGSNADVYCTSFSEFGTQGASWAVDITNENWNQPRIAHVPAFGRLLIVASLDTAMQGSVMGRLSSTFTNDTIGSPFFVSTTGTLKIQPCVGGTNRLGTTNNHFIVAWSRLQTTTRWMLEYRVIDWTGSPVTGVQVLDNVTDVQARQPAVSRTYGDATLPVDLWTVAWLRDEDYDGRGQVWSRSIGWNGNPFGPANFLVENSQQCSDITVTSRFDEPIQISGERPAIVAWAHRFTPITGPQRNIQTRVVDTEEAYALSDVSRDMEDFAEGLDQFDAAISSDGRSFVLAYTEESDVNPGTDDRDLYMVSGSLADGMYGPKIALAERHQLIFDSAETDINVQIAMERDGDPSTLSDSGICVFSTKTNAGTVYGRTSLARVEAATLSVSSQRAVGTQYCDSVPNSVGMATDMRSGSWLWVEGTQELSQMHTLHCLDMPLNQFGLMIAATETGDVLFPGGSAGRLCLGGSFGRYNSQVASSGPGGVFTATIDPSAIVQPNGPVASAPGETWFFQVWHRDLGPGGVPTSTFSNACAVTFLP